MAIRGGGSPDPHEPTMDEVLQEARRAASVYAEAARETERFAARLDVVPDAQDVAEYANLVAREEGARGYRRDTFTALGLNLDSEEGEPGQPAPER